MLKKFKDCEEKNKKVEDCARVKSLCRLYVFSVSFKLFSNPSFQIPKQQISLTFFFFLFFSVYISNYTLIL